MSSPFFNRRKLLAKHKYSILDIKIFFYTPCFLLGLDKREIVKGSF